MNFSEAICFALLCFAESEIQCIENCGCSISLPGFDISGGLLLLNICERSWPSELKELPLGGRYTQSHNYCSISSTSGSSVSCNFNFNLCLWACDSPFSGGGDGSWLSQAATGQDGGFCEKVEQAAGHLPLGWFDSTGVAHSREIPQNKQGKKCEEGTALLE